MWPHARSVKGVCQVTHGDGQIPSASPRARTNPLPGLSPRSRAAWGTLEGQGWLHPHGAGSWWLSCPVLPRVLLPHTDAAALPCTPRAAKPTRFSTPGFPDSPYPSHARCQWAAAGTDSVLSLTFRSFDVATCDERGSDLVTVYDTLSPWNPSRGAVSVLGEWRWAVGCLWWAEPLE